MTGRILLVAAFFLGGVVAEEGNARSKRVRQVPNGSAMSCNTCHKAGGGSPLNSFGLEINANFLTAAGPAGNVLWGPELAALDADGDGASNGAELGDPDGTWVVGEPDPTADDRGDEDDASLAGEVFNPGDPASTPPPEADDTAVAGSTWAQIKQLMGALDGDDSK